MLTNLNSYWSVVFQCLCSYLFFVQYIFKVRLYSVVQLVCFSIWHLAAIMGSCSLCFHLSLCVWLEDRAYTVSCPAVPLCTYARYLFLKVAFWGMHCKCESFLWSGKCIKLNYNVSALCLSVQIENALVHSTCNLFLQCCVYRRIKNCCSASRSMHQIQAVFM